MAEEVHKWEYIKSTEVDPSLLKLVSRLEEYLERQRPTEKDNSDVKITAEDEKAWKVFETQIEEGKPFYYDYPEEEIPQEYAIDAQNIPTKRGIDNESF
jgi:hypothetical protein